MSDPTLPSFRYRMEQQPPRTDCGGVVRGASVRQFPVSKGLAGASMRLQPGCLRELHWHSTAAELGYVVSGSCRTTVLSPDGAETDTFGPGDVWYFPRGWGHSIRGIGSSECRFILIFDDGAFAEEHTLSSSFLMTPSGVLHPSRSRHLQRRIAIRWGPSNRGACRAAAHSGGLLRTSFRSRPRHPPPCWRSSRELCVSFTDTPTPTSGNTTLRVRLRWLSIWGWVTR